MCGRTRSSAKNNKVYVYCRYFENASDKINRAKYMAILADIGEGWGDRNFIKELYVN